MKHGCRAFAALDLGAESGRVMLGCLDASAAELSLELVHRFDNRPVNLHDGLHWDLPGLFADVLHGLARASQLSGPLDGIGVDAWGVDYALLGAGGRMLGLPFHYRDGRVTAELIDDAFGRVGRAELYARTGIQTMPINTSFQLMAEDGGAAIDAAERIAMVPDLFGLWLTGELVNELTIASTTGLVEARAPSWARDLIERLGLASRPFDGDLTAPGTPLGRVLASHAETVGGARNATVLTVAGHDTACAFAAAPVAHENAAILSSGTWSLLGLEVDEPSLGADAMASNLTNERGLDGTIRLLRNVMGLWLLQECRREWRKRGAEYDYETLHRLASAARGDVAVFDPDHEPFLYGGDVLRQIVIACTSAGQAEPSSPGELVRSILVSLACKYRLVLEQLQAVSGRVVEVVHVVGGGARNSLLCQLTADLLGIPVHAGPIEATALGNVLVQARALGELGSLSDIRELVRRSVDIVRYEPSGGCQAQDTYERFLSVTGLSSRGAAETVRRRAS